jgi:hypothetical protein
MSHADAYLIMLHRGFEDQPMELHGDQATALARAEEFAATAGMAREVGTLPVSGQPRRGRGELGPPGVIGRISGFSVVPFRNGLPVPGETVRFVPADREGVTS